MKIAVAAPSTIPARRANTIQVMKMAQALVQCKHEVTVLVPDLKSELKLNKSSSSQWENLANHYGIQNEFPVHWLPSFPPFRHYDFAIKVIRWTRKNRIDLVYTRMPQVAALGSSINLKTIFEVHDLPSGRIGPELFKLFLNGKGAMRLVVITKALLNELEEQFDLPKSPSFTILAPDGVDLDRYQDLPDPKTARQRLRDIRNDLKDLAPDKFTAGYTGHLYDGRGISLIIRIAASLPDANFLIVGGEPDQINQLSEAVLSKGIKNILTTGFVPNAELPLYQASCEVLMLPYQTKVAASSGGDISKFLSPMKLFEYLACGRVIMASDLPVLREVLNPKNAVLLPADMADKWLEALIEIKENPDHWNLLAETARRLSAKYSWKSRAEKIVKNLDFG